MNRLLSIAQVKDVLGMAEKENRLVIRLLKRIAEERSTGFTLTRLGKAYFTTEADLHALLPELVAHNDPDSLTWKVESLSVEVRTLRKRVEVLENALWSQRNAA